MIVLSGKRSKKGAIPVYLNIYDLTPINGYAYWLGLGIYHSGVQGLFFFFRILFLLVSELSLLLFFMGCELKMDLPVFFACFFNLILSVLFLKKILFIAYTVMLLVLSLLLLLFG